MHMCLHTAPSSYSTTCIIAPYSRMVKYLFNSYLLNIRNGLLVV